MLRKTDFELIGTLGRAHGIQGEVSAKLSVDLSGLWGGADTSLFLMLEERGLLIPYRVLSWRTKAGDIDLLRFSDIDTKEQAEQLSGRAVWLDKDYLTEEGGSDLLELSHFVGYELYDATTGQLIGRITDIDDTTLNTLLRVETTTSHERVLPIADELIASVDTQLHRLSLLIPEGLLDL
jgi:ribosome maturation factor rimM